MPHEFQQKPEQSQTKKNDTKPVRQNQDIFQMRWEANLAMQRQEEEELLQGKPNPFATQKQSEEEEKKMPVQTKIAQKAELEDEELMQGKFAQKKSALESDSTPTLGGTTTKMPEDVQAKMEGSFGTDFSNVNIHANDPSAKQMGALAYTQGSDISFANGQYNPSTQSGQELLGHELTHVVQQNQGRVQPTKQGKGMAINDSPTLENEADVMGKQAASGQSVAIKGRGVGIQKATGLSTIPTNNKKKTKISTATITSSGNKLEDLFDLSKNYIIKEPVKSNTTFHGVNSDMQNGLKVYVQSIFNAIKDGKSITRKLDFKTDKPKSLSGYTAASKTKFGKTMIYRFTAYDDKSGTKKIIIEELGEYTKKAPTAAEALKLKAKFDKYFTFGTNKKKVKQQNGTLKDVTFTFSNPEKQEVYKAVSLLPDDVLALIKGVEFLRDDVNPTTANEAGNYSSNHKITLYDLCFKSNNTLFGNLAKGFHSGADQTILHELGHAVDNAKHRVAWKKYDTAQNNHTKAIEAYNIEVASYNKVVGKYNKGAVNKATFDKAKAEYKKKKAAVNTTKIAKATEKTAYLAIVSPSGVKKQLVGTNFTNSSTFQQTDFSKAVVTDGNTPITTYGGTKKSESFAESFALYYVDNERFSTLRPEQTKYFDGKKYK